MVSSYLLLLWAASFLSAGLGMNLNTGDIVSQVSLQLNGTHYCSGSIYSWNIIITAAYCFYERMGYPYKTSREKLCSAIAMKHHDRYQMGLEISKYDIGIIKLWWPFRLEGILKAIPLYKGNIAVGSPVLSTGWGIQGTVGTPVIDYIFPEKLQGTPMVIGDPSECKRYVPWMTTDIICAGIVQIPGCWGDPGGPLIYRKQLLGFVSGGSPHCSGPIFFTSVPHYLSWITEAAEEI